jgi:hypothetical protein
VDIFLDLSLFIFPLGSFMRSSQALAYSLSKFGRTTKFSDYA